MLLDKIYQDFITARKEQNTVKSIFLGLIRAELKNKMITVKKDTLSDAEIIDILIKFKKRMEDSLTGALASKRQDLIDSARNELAILQTYLPKQLSIEEITAVVSEIIKTIGAVSIKDMGKTMTAVKEKIGAAADPKIISDIVKTKLHA